MNCYPQEIEDQSAVLPEFPSSRKHQLNKPTIHRKLSNFYAKYIYTNNINILKIIIYIFQGLIVVNNQAPRSLEE